MVHPQAQAVGYWQRLVYIMLPLFLLLLFLGLLNGWKPVETAVLPPTATATAIPTPPTITVISPPTSAPTATPLPTMTAAATETAVLPSNTIHLLGPPANAQLNSPTTISFYWQYTQSLLPDQFFVVYLQHGNILEPVGQQTEPNLGQIFQLQATLTPSQPAEWWVALHSTTTPQPVATSPRRLLNSVPSP